MKGRPFVTANFAMTWDGRVSTRRFTPTNFTSKRDKHRLLEIRATADAVLVGVSTIVADNMAMGMPDETLRAARIKRGQSAFPLRVLASNSGRIPKNLRVFSTAAAPIVIFSTTQMASATRSRLARLADLWLHGSPHVNLAAMLATLRADYGVRRVVCEGGPRLFRALLDEQLIDEIHLTLAPRIFGGTGAPTLTGLAGEFLPRSTAFTLRAMEIIEGECFLRYRVRCGRNRRHERNLVR
jgi:2,5-diamino-6-(ribosylamino)-4(3H)-pyrimidinone 5'-phosphate reductase